MDKVIVLAATINQLPIIRLLKELGVYVITVDNIPENIGHAEADKNYNLDITDITKVFEIAQSEKIKAIIAAYTDVGVKTASFVSEQLNLVGCNFQAAKTLTNKSEFRSFYKKEIDPHFLFKTFTKSEFKGWAQAKHESKWIVKPVDSSGSKGIEIISSDDNAAIIRAFDYSNKKQIIVEQFHVGRQGTLEGFLSHGKLKLSLITNRLTAPAPHVATQGHVFPSDFNAIEQKEIEQVVLSICTKLNINEGPLDVDFVFNEEGAHIIEMSPRLGGNNLSNFLEAVTKVDLRRMTVNYYLGEKVDNLDVQIEKNVKFVQWVMTSNTAGTLIYNSKKACEALELEYVEELTIFESSGSTVNKFTNGRDSYGFLILKLPIEASIPTYLKELETFIELKVESES